MMYRSGWGSKPGQEVVLAVWLQRCVFDAMLAQAIPSHFVPEVYASGAAWQDAIAHSLVRLQWDPDHDPSGAPVQRRALQLGLRGEVLAHYAQEWILALEDISEFVREQHIHAQFGTYAQLVTPQERVYPVTDAMVAAKLGVPAKGRRV